MDGRITRLPNDPIAQFGDHVSPLDEHESPEDRADGVGEGPEARAAGHLIDVPRVEVVRGVEQLDSQIGAPALHGERPVYDHVQRHEGWELAAVGRAGVLLTLVEHGVWKA